MFKPLYEDSREPLPEKMVNYIAECLGGIGSAIANLQNVDYSAGAAKTGPMEKCFWDKEGRRITISATIDGGIIADRSKEVDPEYKPEKLN